MRASHRGPDGSGGIKNSPPRGEARSRDIGARDEKKLRKWDENGEKTKTQAPLRKPVRPKAPTAKAAKDRKREKGPVTSKGIGEGGGSGGDQCSVSAASPPCNTFAAGLRPSVPGPLGRRRGTAGTEGGCGTEVIERQYVAPYCIGFHYSGIIGRG